MHVLLLAESADEAGVAREMRHDPELDLRVVGGYQAVIGRRDERLANAASFGFADRDVLQVRIR